MIPEVPFRQPVNQVGVILARNKELEHVQR
jgi:hypothetical protein